MKDIGAKLIFVIVDLLAIFITIILAYFFRNEMETLFGHTNSYPLTNYIFFAPIYITTVGLFLYEGIYTYRYDFWHESKLIFKSVFFSFLIVMAYLAMTKSVQEYSRAVIIFAFVLMPLLIPITKYIVKKLLYHLGLWQRKAEVYGNDPFLKEEIFENHYLGYVPSHDSDSYTIFINSTGEDQQTLKKIIDDKLNHKNEVIFVPLIDDFDLTHSHIYHLSNTHTNLIVFQNRLKSRYRLWIKQLSDILLTTITLPILIPLMLFIAYKIRKEEPGSSILFKQKRLGQNGKVFVCYKFRTMFEDNDNKLEAYLKEHPEEIEYYDIYHKYKNDPRITKIGHFLRRTSLDEITQIFNVMKNEMSFIGPRPYMLNEKDKIGKDIHLILTVKPGITGLWQVSGRSEVDFHSRVKLDAWYIRNWNLWMDLIILVKTVKTVVVQKGAK